MAKTNIPPAPNFIVAALGDNDYGWDLAKGLAEGMERYEYHKKLCPILWKRFLIGYLIGEQLKFRVELCDSERIDLKAIANLEEYLFSGLTVTFEQKRPTDDDDGGSAWLDLHTGQSSTY